MLKRNSTFIFTWHISQEDSEASATSLCKTCHGGNSTALLGSACRIHRSLRSLASFARLLWVQNAGGVSICLELVTRTTRIACSTCPVEANCRLTIFRVTPPASLVCTLSAFCPVPSWKSALLKAQAMSASECANVPWCSVKTSPTASTAFPPATRDAGALMLAARTAMGTYAGKSAIVTEKQAHSGS
jgi:hypothetical protein